jgi:hypothetical protein
MDARQQTPGALWVIGLICVVGTAFFIHSQTENPAHHPDIPQSVPAWSPSLGGHATIVKYAMLCRSKGVLQDFDKRTTLAHAANDKVGADSAFDDAMESGCKVAQSAAASALVINEDPAILEPSIARVRLQDGYAYWVQSRFLKQPNTSAPTQ